MADEVIVHLTGVAKREAEAAVGYELQPISPQGDQFRVPKAVADRLGDLPPTPPKAEDPQSTKRAAQALPFDVDNQPEAPEPATAKAHEDADAVPVSGPSVTVSH